MFVSYKSVLLLLAVLLVTVALYPLSFFAADLATTAEIGTNKLSIPKCSATISLPKSFSYSEDFSVEKDVLYSVLISDKRQNLLGYIQVWSIKDLTGFLDNARSLSRFEFTSYSKKEAGINNHKGFMLDWTALSKEKKIISGKEFFLKCKDNDVTLRVSFFTNQGPFSPQQEKVIADIVSSIK